MGGEAGPQRAWWPPEHFGLILSDMGATALCKGNRQWGLAHSGKQGAGRPGSGMLAGKWCAGRCGAELCVDGGGWLLERPQRLLQIGHTSTSSHGLTPQPQEVSLGRRCVAEVPTCICDGCKPAPGDMTMLFPTAPGLGGHLWLLTGRNPWMEDSSSWKW